MSNNQYILTQNQLEPVSYGQQLNFEKNKNKTHLKSQKFYTPFEMFQYKPIESLKQKLLMQKRFGR